MAFKDDYGLSDPMISDIAKGATVAITLSLLTGQRMPTMMELGTSAAALAIYWNTVHRILP